MSFVSSKGNILCRLINIELYKIFAIINRAIKGLYCIVNKIPLKFVPKGLTDNKPTLPHITALCQTGDKPLFEPMMVYRWICKPQCLFVGGHNNLTCLLPGKPFSYVFPWTEIFEFWTNFTEMYFLKGFGRQPNQPQPTKYMKFRSKSKYLFHSLQLKPYSIRHLG